jgi:hypothetical protein
MKKIFLALFSICFLTNIFAQDFAPIGAKWHYTEEFSFSGDISYLYVESVADTIIKGKNCRKLVSNGGLMCGYHSYNDYVYNQDSTVYFYLAATNTFQILYDFKTKKDSSWIVVYSTYFFPYLDTMKVTVDSISYVNINGYNLKKLWVAYKPMQTGFGIYYHSTIVDKIGDFNYLFNLETYRLACDGNYSQGLRCYQDPQFGFYNTGIASSCTYTGINEIMSDKIEIYPNPATDLINISFYKRYKEELKLNIYTITGVLIKSETLTQNNQQINTEELSNGLYLVEIKSKDKSAIQKLIIQR